VFGGNLAAPFPPALVRHAGIGHISRNSQNGQPARGIWALPDNHVHCLPSFYRGAAGYR